ncbi:MAG: signal peptidase I [Ruminococcaceae bacterium]|nr:signal peptidase I [Oscillospiraceae bacterium]
MENTQKKILNPTALRHAYLTVFDWVTVASVVLVVVTLLLTYVFRLVGVQGDSMKSTLHHGDRLLLSSTASVYQSGDIVVIDRYTEEPLIKRVIAVGGNTVEIKDAEVYVNDRKLEEHYAQFDKANANGRYYEKIIVPRGYLFVLGDNRDHSQDSRDDEIGLISVNDVVGRVVYCIWPPARFGSVQ